jgi:hypothetical protein
MFSEVISSLFETDLYPNLWVVKTKAIDKSKAMTASVAHENILKRTVVDQVLKISWLICRPPELFEKTFLALTYGFHCIIVFAHFKQEDRVFGCSIPQISA